MAFGIADLTRRAVNTGGPLPSDSLRGQVAGVGAEADRLGSLRSRVRASIGTAPARELRRVRQTGGLAVQQRFGDQATGATTQSSTLQNALARAKARVGIEGRGEAAIRNQQLKDRLTQVRSGIAGLGRGIRTQVSARNIQAGVNLGVGEAKDFGRAAVAGAFGTAAGALGAGILERRRNKQADIFSLPPSDPSTTPPTHPDR